MVSMELFVIVWSDLERRGGGVAGFGGGKKCTMMAEFGGEIEHIREGHVLGEAVTGLERHGCDYWMGEVGDGGKRKKSFDG